MFEAIGIDRWAFTDLLAEGVYVVDAEGLCTFVNSAALQLLGYEAREDLVGRNMHGLIHHTRPDGTAFPAEAGPLLHALASGQIGASG